MTLPMLHVPTAPDRYTLAEDPRAWDAIPALTPFLLADGSGPALQQTVARLCYDEQWLYVRFDCADRDSWGTFTQRDEPLYDEEVVELFISAGEATPTRYYEFEVSPLGAVLDAAVFNPTSRRAELAVDLSWDCAGLQWQAWRGEGGGAWGALLTIPWASIAPAGPPPRLWRANLYRIERPRDAAPEFSCWSPTMTDPADFHKPKYFGLLELV